MSKLFLDIFLNELLIFLINFDGILLSFFRIIDLNLEKTDSIGLYSGQYGTLIIEQSVVSNLILFLNGEFLHYPLINIEGMSIYQ